VKQSWQATTLLTVSDNRRRFVRVRATLRFTFAWADADGTSHFELFRTIDVSASGVQLVCHVVGGAVPSVGVRGEGAFNVDSTEVRCEAEVVRLTDEGFAVRLQRLPRQLEDKVVAWVFRTEALRMSRRPM
jgi:c-di-GMP-binding flagellar brake protein YcgR